ncbi:MAG: 4-alpha-glucanotransferase [Dehalococcoidales bacterium]|nr:4-alpha-glucanotransferase [Dehalococcoidales bacterium]
MSHASGSLLHRLARLYGIQTAYYDVNRRRRQASAESLVAVLRSLGAPMAGLGEVASAWRQRRQELWQQLLEPVVIAWDGAPPLVNLRLPESLAEAPLTCHLELENGEEKSWQCSGAELTLVEHVEIEGTRYLARQLRLPTGLPWGYHRLTVSLGGKRAQTLIVSAPLVACLPADKDNDRMWGGFLPLYALRRNDRWGGGDFSDLEALAGWLGGMGGGVVVTLPLLATFLDDTLEPSPYLPVSRRLWNEFYLDMDRIPELERCAPTRALLASSSFQKETKALRRLPLVDYRRQMGLKRRLLGTLCRCMFSEPSPRLDELRHFADTNPLVEEYARFRAAGEQRGISWRSWPQPLRDGIIADTDYAEESKRYHLYVQWLAHQQIERASKMVRDEGLKLYLDLPLGTHPDGYDVWREPDAFVRGASAGAPPDAVFTRGQNWRFPPLHPEGVREQGYRYVTSCLRHHLKHAGILRIDHVMGLHRLFFIPSGMEAGQGVYVRYRAEEFYAILALEAHRYGAIIVGEDLGTVPRYVRPAMKKHGLHRMYVAQYELACDRRRLNPVPSGAVASLNTHDMSPFAALWQGREIEQRQQFGLLDSADARAEAARLRSLKETLLTFLREHGWLRESGTDTQAVLRACLSFLAASRARLVLVNLEDLWLETQPQNVPTAEDNPNWRRKARYTFKQFCRLPQVFDTLLTVNELRKRGKYR